MKTIFGVSSATPINNKLKNGHTMYDWVVRKNCYPSFCMRVLAGENRLTHKEIDFLKTKGCKIGLIFNDLTEKEVSTISGVLSAERAVNFALELGVPVNAGIVLFAEIKPEWSVNHNWMISFASTLTAKGFVAGIIGNTDSSKNFNFDRQTGHFANSTKNMNYYDAVFVATEPKIDNAPAEWLPYCPSDLEVADISFWSCSETTFDEIKVNNIYARDDKSLMGLW
jgi:hypothetical protein